jgi:hypothetical protein
VQPATVNLVVRIFAGRCGSLIIYGVAPESGQLVVPPGTITADNGHRAAERSPKITKGPG